MSEGAQDVADRACRAAHVLPDVPLLDRNAGQEEARIAER